MGELAGKRPADWGLINDAMINGKRIIKAEPICTCGLCVIARRKGLPECRVPHKPRKPRLKAGGIGEN